MRDIKDIFNEYDTTEGITFKLLSKKIHFPEDNESLYEYVYDMVKDGFNGVEELKQEAETDFIEKIRQY